MRNAVLTSEVLGMVRVDRPARRGAAVRATTAAALLIILVSGCASSAPVEDAEPPSSTPAAQEPVAAPPSEPAYEPLVTAVAVSTSTPTISEQDEYQFGPHSAIFADGDELQQDASRTFRMIAVAPGVPAVDTVETLTAADSAGSISETEYAAQSNADAEPGFAVVYGDEFAASGAQPQRTVIMLARFDANGAASGMPVPVIEAFDGMYLNDAWVIGDVTVLSYADVNYDTVLIGLAPDGSTLWRVDGMSSEYDGYYAHDGILVAGAGGDDLVGLDAATGSIVWSMAAAGLNFAGLESILGSGYLLALLREPGRPSADGVILDASSGQIVRSMPGVESVLYDASSERFVSVGYVAEAEGQELHVFDAGGTDTFSIDAATFEALGHPYGGNPSLLGVAGGTVWIDGSDGVNLFDQITGEADPLLSRVDAAPFPAQPRLSEGFLSVFTTGWGYVVAVHQDADLDRELAVEVPYLVDP